VNGILTRFQFIILLLICLCSLNGCRSVTVAIQETFYTPANDPLKDKTYLYFIHGLDPFDIADLAGLERHFRELGYSHTKLVQFYGGEDVVGDIVQAKANCPDARIMILGFSAGTLTASGVVNTLHDKHQIDVDIVVYTAGIALMDNASTRPSYVGKIIHILDGGVMFPGIELTGADNYRFEDVWHFGTPNHENTVALVEAELKKGILARP